MNSELFNKIYELNKKLYQEAESPLRSHGPDHHYRVTMNALKLAKSLNVNIDEDVLIAAGMLHDLAAYYPEKTGEDYHDYDHVLAEKALREINFPQEKLSLVIDAIKNHGSDSKYKKDDEPAEMTILRDADKLDVFGPLGVARIIMVRTLKGDTLDQIVDDFYYQGHLQRKWESVTTEEAKEMAKDDYEYAMNFFKKLADKLASEFNI